MRYLFIILVFLKLSFSTYAATASNFTEQIHIICPKIKSLIIKKSLIELINNTSSNCEGLFTKTIIRKCPSLNCQVLISIYTEIMEKESGKVIGR